MNRYLAALEEFRPIGVDTRTMNILLSHKIFSVADLGAFTEEQLGQLPGIGPKTIARLKSHLRGNPD